MSFWHELKRRKVVQVATVYAVVAWLLIQVASTVEEPLGLPAWFDAAIITLLAIGFPIAVILAWAFDLTPGGSPPASVSRGDRIDVQPRAQLFSQVTQVLILLAVGFLIVDQYFLDDAAQSINVSGGSSPTTRWLIDLRPAEVLVGAHPIERTLYGGSVPSRRAIAISPDGRMLAFTAKSGDRQALYVRRLEELEAVEIQGTGDADSPFFSPDGLNIGYWANNALWRVPSAGGTPVRIVEAEQPYGASWNEPDRIVFAQFETIWSVDPEGGEATQLTTLATGAEVRHAHPEVLPGGRWLLYSSQPRDYGWDEARIIAKSLETGEEKTLVEGAADARFVPETGHLVYMRLGTLMARPFDAGSAESMSGEAGITDLVLQSVNRGNTLIDTGAGQYSIASDGTLAYLHGELFGDAVGTLLWVDRAGTIEEIETGAPGRSFFAPSLSPDASSIAIGTFGLNDHSIYRLDFATQVLDRLTFAGWGAIPEWSPDGSRIAINLAETGARNVYSITPEGEELMQLAPAPIEFQYPASWSSDARSLVFGQGNDLYVWSQDADPPVRRLTNSPARIIGAELSPDGNWLAYVYEEAGRFEVHVASYPDMSSSQQVSARGGRAPVWSSDGRKLVYLEPIQDDPEQRLSVVEIDVTIIDGRFSRSAARKLFDVPWYAPAGVKRGYDMTADAQRFIFVRRSYAIPDADLDRIHVVHNWFDILKERAPVRPVE